MKLEDWLRRLEQLHFKSIDMGLDRIKPVAESLGLLKNNPYIITVAGTNGKGSTIAVMEGALSQAGYEAGVYTSPHLVRFNERIRVNSQGVEDIEITSALESVDRCRGTTSLTYFEFTTLAALTIFKQKGLNVWLLEVGLGGRLDAVNICDPDIAVVTSIDLDHQQWLGDSREQIGLEKIGVGRRDKPLVVGEKDIPETVLQAIQQQGSELFRVKRDYDFRNEGGELTIQLNLQGNSETVQDKSETMDCLQLGLSHLLPVNIATAAQALSLSPFKITQKQFQDGLEQITLKGRQQWINSNPPMVLDVGHNPHAAKALCRTLSSYRKQSKASRIYCVVGMLADKAIADTLQELLPVVDNWYPVSLNAERAAKAQHIKDELLEMGAFVARHGGSPAQCCERLKLELSDNTIKKPLILVFGSFYTVAEVIQYLQP